MVIGGGVVGMATALALQDRGLAVMLADPEIAQQTGSSSASWGNAGRIAVEQNEPLASLATLRSLPGMLFSRGGPVSLPPPAVTAWLPFGLRLIAASTPRRFARGVLALTALLAPALSAWRNLLDGIDAADLLAETGHYSLWEDELSWRAGRAAWQRNAGAATAMDMDAAQLERLRTLIKAPIVGAMTFTGTASIADPALLLTAMHAAFLGRGGTIQASLTSVDEAARIADAVVVAAGIGSADLMRKTGHVVPLIAERGYHIQQEDSHWPSDLPPIFFEERTVVLTRFRSALRATSFAEFTHAKTAPDQRKWSRLQEHARDLGLPFDRHATRWCGSRPTLPDYLPAIGRSRRRNNLFYAFGHQHLGLTLAAVTGNLIGDLVCSPAGSFDLEPFDIERF